MPDAVGACGIAASKRFNAYRQTTLSRAGTLSTFYLGEEAAFLGKEILERIGEGFIGGTNDILVHSDGAPGVGAIGA